GWSRSCESFPRPYPAVCSSGGRGHRPLAAESRPPAFPNTSEPVTSAQASGRRSSEIDPRAHFDGTVHPNPVGAGLNRVPVAQVGEVIDVHQEHRALGSRSNLISEPGSEKPVARDGALVLRVNEPFGDPRCTGIESQPWDPRRTDGKPHIA